MKLIVLISVLLLSALGSELALACDEAETPGYTLFQGIDAQFDGTIIDETEDGICDSGCCMIGCYCCSLHTIEPLSTNSLTGLTSKVTPTGSLLTAHSILPLRPPIA